MSQIDLQWFGPEDEGKTEEATETKLRKAREEGRVAKSQEMNGAIVLLFVSIALVLLAPWIYKKIIVMMNFCFSNVATMEVTDSKLFHLFLITMMPIVLSLCAIGVVAAIIVNLVQNKGYFFTTKTIEMKFSKIVPKFGEYFRRNFFSVLGVVNILKSIVKLIIIGSVAYIQIKSDLPATLDFLHTGGIYMAMVTVAKMVAKLLITCAVLLVAIGVFDYVMQRREFLKQNKMTKQEIKEEFKEAEGDPEVKGRLEQAQKEMLKANMPKAVRESDVVITNPTHYAVALKWDSETQEAPMVNAKGVDETAQRIKAIAGENDVPIVENRPLARDLYSNFEVGTIIPQQYLRLIADIYANIGYMEKH
ncbi:EscU/YscU/HrcU family type III secretion system export apparatus switch protein [Treponema sp.]|uniref:EscU/YscU/HrcU family type III secretion system export apparatus switch protein n=1 Tax=Treponema sp. TaxID=166 RepID=UPI00298E0D10|nr:EscU/YscU/HrcU family type III secretion system export apparatus switch protein [Treponema sp.]MCQ2242012.1 EscU/YscU/HrcU family type III secretion system export apparatus switch protein [Treponema sp.]